MKVDLEHQPEKIENTNDGKKKERGNANFAILIATMSGSQGGLESNQGEAVMRMFRGGIVTEKETEMILDEVRISGGARIVGVLGTGIGIGGLLLQFAALMGGGTQVMLDA